MFQQSSNIIILAIKPEFATRIYEGQKKFELRKTAPRKEPLVAFLYESNHVRAITGYVVFKKIIHTSVSKLWKRLSKYGANRERFLAYFASQSKGYLLEIKEAVRLKESLNLSLLQSIDPKFKTPQNFHYLNGNSLLSKHLFPLLKKTPAFEIDLQRLLKGEFNDFKKLVKKYVGKDYKDIDAGFSKHLIESTQLGYDRFGYFTKGKTVYRVLFKGKKIGYTTITEKLGGSIKTGPTIFYEQHQDKGLGQQLRRFIENQYRQKLFRKIYCTVSLQNFQAIKYLIKSGYRVEAHLEKQYSENTDELIFGKLLRVGPKAYRVIKRRNVDINRLATTVSNIGQFRNFILKHLPSFYMRVDDNFVRSLIASFKSAPEDQYYGKPKKPFCCFHDKDLVAVFICSPKRGGAVKITPLILTKQKESLATVIRKIEVYYIQKNKRKLYLTVPIFDTFSIELFSNLGYKIEGILQEPYRDGVDMISFGKLLQSLRDR